MQVPPEDSSTLCSVAPPYLRALGPALRFLRKRPGGELPLARLVERRPPGAVILSVALLALALGPRTCELVPRASGCGLRPRVGARSGGAAMPRSPPECRGQCHQTRKANPCGTPRSLSPARQPSIGPHIQPPRPDAKTTDPPEIGGLPVSPSSRPAHAQ